MTGVEAIEIDGVLRPMRDSAGRLIAGGEYEKLAAFWLWFRESAGVDALGQPRMVYHGSPKSTIESFDRSCEGSNTGAADDEHGLGGFYFSDNPHIADTYARTIEVEMANIAEQEFSIAPRPDLPASTTYAVYLCIQNPLMVNGIVTRAVLDQAERDGHDGVIARVGSNTEYVVFAPEQIKSAIGNPGSYDPTDPRLVDNANWNEEMRPRRRHAP